jgi:hypothetical protein
MPGTNDGECVRCGGRLEAGYGRDQTHGGNVPQVWIPGKPERGIFGGLKVRRADVKRGYFVEAWRCATCATIEWFARERTVKP